MKKKDRYFVYAIRSISTRRVYIGQAQDLKERLRRHNAGEVISTKDDKPWEIVTYQVFNSRSQAMWKEKDLKRSKGKRLSWMENQKRY